MGWTGVEWRKGDTVKEFITREIFDPIGAKVLFYSKKGFGTHFFGAELKYGKKILLIVLTQFQRNRYGGTDIFYKEIDEEMGPVELANKKTLAWLEENIPDPPNEWARKWRENSRNYLNSKDTHQKMYNF